MASTATPPLDAVAGDGYHHGDLRAACIHAGIRLVEDGRPGRGDDPRCGPARRGLPSGAAPPLPRS